MDLEDLALVRAEEQMERRESWLRDPHYHCGRPDWGDVAYPRTLPRHEARLRCLAGDCEDRPYQFGRFAGYCKRHADHLETHGTVEIMEWIRP